jgi:hypothetical protein
MPSLRRQCLARFYRYLMAGFEVTINGRFWVTAEVPIRPHRLDPAKEAQPLVMLTGGGHGGLAPAHRPPRPTWDESKSRSRRQRPEGLSLFALKFAGVLFETTSNPGHSFVVGMKVAIGQPLQDKAQSLQPIARLARLEFDVALFAQEFHHDCFIPAASLQTKILRRLLQRLL